MRAIGDGPRNFEPWSSDENGTSVGTSPSKLPHHANGRTLFDRLNMHQHPLYGRTSVEPRLEPATHRSRVRDHNHCATAVTYDENENITQ
ncbi:hypothetical protein TNCV_1230571 [Trichonephila clavipes]|nr:hypothetical protein TNCV_1230571 [Trichonephila clavipes]